MDISSRYHTIRVWLLAVAALIVLMVAVGGATRLTESGLSIVEWKPVTGVFPPLSHTGWEAEFAKYRETSQYRLQNAGMSLDEFKTIYWWEWAHRALGRLIGLAFLIPLLWFEWRGRISAELRWRLWGIFGLGALQGLVGWWMVASGLTERVDVSQYRLATHLILAVVIYGAIVWTADQLGHRGSTAGSARARAGAAAIVALTLTQIYLGGLVAGLDAGLVHNTWPLIDGAFVPPLPDLFPNAPWWRNLFEHHLTVQFNHRIAAYLLWIAAALHALDLSRGEDSAAGRRARTLLAAVTLQGVIGIATLLWQVPILLALLHQVTAIGVFTIAVIHAGRIWGRPIVVRAVSPATISPAAY